MKQHRINHLGCDLHYWIRQGEGKEWLVFLHGAGLDHHMFDLQFAAIPKHFNILAWDARGHGQSTIESNLPIDYADMIKDVATICKTENIAKATFIGQSMGGYLCQDVAYYHPKLVSSMILIDCARNFNKLSTAEKVGLKFLPIMLKSQPEPIFIAKSAKMCGKYPSTISFVQQKMGAMGKTRLIETLTSLRQAFHEDQTYQSHCPILLICGKEDKVSIIIKHMKTWRKKDKKAYDLVWIKNAAHCSNQDNPEPVNQAINKHLSKFSGKFSV